MCIYNNRRKFRSQTSDNMDRWKSRGGKSWRREEKKREAQRRERVRRKKMEVMRDEKSRAVVARCTFASEKAKNTSRLEHFWKLRCWKSARRCGAEHVSKSNAQNRALLEVEMIKKCTPLWREAHFEVRMLKTPHVRAAFGRWSVVLCDRCKGFCTLPKMSKTWRLQIHTPATTTTNTTTTTLHDTTLHYTNYSTLHHKYNCHYITLHYTTLQLQLHYFTLHYTRTTLHCITLQHTTLQYTTLITLHHTTLITLHYNYNSTRLHHNYVQLQLQLRYTTSSSCGEVTAATIATTPKNTTPNTFQSISGFALPSVIHNNQALP